MFKRQVYIICKMKSFRMFYYNVKVIDENLEKQEAQSLTLWNIIFYSFIIRVETTDRGKPKSINRKLEKRLTDLEKIQPKSERTAEGTMWNLLIFQMIYQIINSKASLYRIAVSQVWRLITMTLRVVIVSLFQDIVEVITKG